MASSWRPAALTARCRLADSALSTRLSSPRSARETCRASTSSSAPVAPIRRRNVPTASPLFDVTTPRPRRSAPGRRAARCRPGGRRAPAPRPAGSTNSRWVRPPARLSEPRARNRPRSQAARQWSPAPVQSNGVVERPLGRPPQPDRPAGQPTARGRSGPGPRPSASATRSHGRDGSMAASSSRSAVTRSRSERVIVRRSGQPPDGGPPRFALERPDERRGEADRIVVVRIVRVDHVVEDQPRVPRTRRRPAQLDRLGGPVGGRPGPELVVGQDDVDQTRARCGRRAPRRGRPGRTRPSRRPGSPRCRRRPAAHRRPGPRRGWPGSAGSAAGSCTGCPGPSTISSASAIAASASSDAPDVAGRQPDPVDPAWSA